MTLNFSYIKNTFYWIIGVIFLLTSLGGFTTEDYIFGLIFLLLGLLILPPTGNWLRGLISGKYLLSDLNFFDNSSNKFINSLDFNDDKLIQSIDKYFLSTNKTISDKRKKHIGKKLFFNYLKYTLNDLQISTKEKLKLQEIEKYFVLSKKDISEIKSRLNKKSIETLIIKSYDDKILSDKEEMEIINLAEYLELPKGYVEKIRNKISSSILNSALKDKLSDNRLTPKEESELTKLLSDLKISKEQFSKIIPQKKLNQLEYAKLLWSLDKGIFYPIQNPPITLKRKEECYLILPAKLIEFKTVHKGYSYNNSSISIPIMKGVRYRIGGGRAKPIKKEVKIKYPGKLLLTNLRIVFISNGNKSFQIPFSKLLSFNVYLDGLEFILSRKGYILNLSSKNVELFSVGLASAIRNFLDSDNDILKKAIKEIELNDSFIDL